MKMNEETAGKIAKLLGCGQLKQNEMMKEHTSMKVGGPADLFLAPQSIGDIQVIIGELKEEAIPYFVLGNGSNVIFRDEGYRGAVICLSDRFKGYRVTEGADGSGEADVVVKSGTLNKDLSDGLIRLGLSGFEFASGIPGSMGGATAMNAGAYDGEMKNIIKEVKLLDDNGNIVTVPGEEMDFGYRHSLVSSGDYIVLETTLTLKKDDPEKIQARVDELTGKREEKQPLEYPSCGSTFKRPEGYFAGKLISDAGLKGYRIGGAQVSEKHAGFVINRDNATAADVLELIEHIKAKVYETQGVWLECEVKII